MNPLRRVDAVASAKSSGDRPTMRFAISLRFCVSAIRAAPL